MTCDERIRLREAYNRATLAFSVSVQHLLNGGGLVPSAIYDQRRQFESARLAYEAHIQEHHCEGGGGATNLEVISSARKAPE